ncbi:endolytic transglycosylase MltG, partial [Desulfovibrio sp. XJ01]|nr:endolytic transglycosylase MltG [Nitratidesulfovibrio liaohensis]
MPPAAAPAPATQSAACPAPSRPVVRLLLRVLAALVLLVLLACGYAGYDAWRFLHTPPASPGADVYVDVEPGASFDRVTRQLVDKGAVTSDWRFKLLAHYHGWETSLKAGRFLVHSNWAPFRVLDQLVNGQPVLSRITLREGLTWWETARLLEVEGFVTVEDFRAVITDPAFLRHWGIPFDTAEGFLFPDTYLIKKPATPDRESARAVAGRMVDTFWRRAAQVWPGGRPARDELRRLVTLASIVEKETGQPSERGRVAGVYANRLRTGMLLQADPTTIYGLGDTFDGNLRRSHLQDAANPYNTYRRPGLPPGPICSPGLESLRAATTPEKHGYFYFVSRNDGSHQFSATLDEHNRAVNRFQRGGRARGGDQTATQGTPATSVPPVNPTDGTGAPDATGATGATGATDATPPTDTAAPASTSTAPKTPEVQAKASAPAAGDKATAPDVGDKAVEPGVPANGTTAPATPPATQPGPADSGAPATTATTATDVPAVSQSLKTTPGAKPALTPLPRPATPAGNATTGAPGANATAPANAGVR